MSKNGVRGYIILAVILVVLNVIAFAIPFSKTAVFWIGYLFGVVAILFQIYLFKISFSGDGDVKSKFYGFPIARVGVIYLIVQLVISIIEMATAAFFPLWIGLIVNVILLALTVLGYVAADAMRDEIVRQDVQLRKDVTNMRALQSMSSALAGQCTDSELKAALQKVAEEFKFSDPVSSEQTIAIEADLKQLISDTQSAVLEGDVSSAKDLSSKILMTINERNRLCSLNK